MDKHTAKDYLPLVQALAEGKTIQYKNPRGEWCDKEETFFNFAPEVYRIKPRRIEKTQEMWVHDKIKVLYPVSTEDLPDRWEASNWKRRIVTISYEE